MPKTAYMRFVGLVFWLNSAMRTNAIRLETLRQLAILDSEPEKAYDDLTKALARSFDVPIAMVNLLDEKRDWFKACLGLPVGEWPASKSFCEVFFSTDVDSLVVEDALQEARFASHPLVVGFPFIRFYAGARLAVNGQTVGTLCVYDTKPKHIDPAQLAELQATTTAVVEMLRRRCK